VALSDAELVAVADAVWREWEDGDGRETIPEVEARALRAVADAAVADFSEELMA
jgi:hypothetical protein